MYTRLFISILLCAMALLSACGKDSSTSIILKGSISTGEMEPLVTGPLMIAVTTTDDIDELEENPEESIVIFAGIDEYEMNYELDLSEMDLKAGNSVYIIAFADNNYTGGIPIPDEGDFIGFYADRGNMTAEYILKEGKNLDINIEIAREIFSYDAEITGTVTANETGQCTLVAYAGVVTSSDFSKLDINKIIGYTEITKETQTAEYSMKVMPYGFDVPVEKVQVFALLDVNENGKVDAGDMAGYHRQREVNLPRLITINEGTNPGIDIGEFAMEVPEPSGVNISMRGTFSMPYGYDKDSPPIYVMVADVTDPETLYNDPISSIKFFHRMEPGEFYFDIDLSSTDLEPGDTVSVVGLWDKDNDGGFPNPTRGDKIGFILNNDTYAFSTELKIGENPVPEEGYEFNINRVIYDFDASIMYALDRGTIDSWIMDRSQIIVMAIHAGGVVFSVNSSGDPTVQVDMDYLLGISMVKPPEFDTNPDGTQPVIEAEEDMRELELMPAVFQEIVVYEDSAAPDPLIQGVTTNQGNDETAYVIAVLDKNGNGKMDSDDTVGYYSEEYVVEDGDTIAIPGYGTVTPPPGTYYTPAAIEIIHKGRNKELVNDGGTPDDASDDTRGPFWVDFTYYEAP